MKLSLNAWHRLKICPNPTIWQQEAILDNTENRQLLFNSSEVLVLELLFWLVRIIVCKSYVPKNPQIAQFHFVSGPLVTLYYPVTVGLYYCLSSCAISWEPSKNSYFKTQEQKSHTFILDAVSVGFLLQGQCQKNKRHFDSSTLKGFHWESPAPVCALKSPNSPETWTKIKVEIASSL